MPTSLLAVGTGATSATSGDCAVPIAATNASGWPAVPAAGSAATVPGGCGGSDGGGGAVWPLPTGFGAVTVVPWGSLAEATAGFPVAVRGGRRLACPGSSLNRIEPVRGVAAAGFVVLGSADGSGVAAAPVAFGVVGDVAWSGCVNCWLGRTGSGATATAGPVVVGEVGDGVPVANGSVPFGRLRPCCRWSPYPRNLRPPRSAFQVSCWTASSAAAAGCPPGSVQPTAAPARSGSRRAWSASSSPSPPPRDRVGAASNPAEIRIATTNAVPLYPRVLGASSGVIRMNSQTAASPAPADGRTDDEAAAVLQRLPENEGQRKGDRKRREHALAQASAADRT